MNFTKLLPNIQNSLESIFNTYPKVSQIIKEINKKNGTPYLVGGAVRDIFLNIKIKDIDIEVHNLNLEELAGILDKFGEVNYVGKSFGVLKINSLDIDWSLPRTDASGRKPDVIIDPYMNIKEALKRRDLTINAMAINLVTKELMDPFDGYKDLTNKILRSPDPQFFTEDPLRFYRVMQFISRFEMYPDKILEKICADMDIKNVSIERIESEFEKLMLKSMQPSLGIRWLLKIGRLKEILPPLFESTKIEQDSEWHPEGDVFEHSMQALDAAALLTYNNLEEKLIILYAALCHDLGKNITTKFINGKIRSYGHAEAGVPIAKNLLKRITRKAKIIESVGTLVRHHMEPGQFVKQNSSLAAYKRLALKLARANCNMEMLSKLLVADKRGRNAEGLKPLDCAVPTAQEFVNRAQDAQVLNKPEEPILFGRDIKDLVSAGPVMGQLLKYAYEIQIKQGIQDKEKLLKMVALKLKDI